MTSQLYSRALASVFAFASTWLISAPYAVASSGPLKVGYINLDSIKQQLPDVGTPDMLRVQGENQMRDVVAKANDALAKAKADNKPKEEIDRMTRDLQNQVSGMQQGIMFAVGLETTKVNQRIHLVAEQVAKEHGLDVVVDGSNIFAGSEKLVASGENLTEAVLKQLQAKAAAPK